MPSAKTPSPSRRRLLTTGLAAGSAALGYTVAQSFSGKTVPVEPEASVATASLEVSPFGDVQPGIVAPDPRQEQLGVLVFKLKDLTRAPEILDQVGQLAVELHDGEHLAGLAPDGITLTVGVGPRVVRAHLGEETQGAQELPAFLRDELPTDHTNGDLMVQICTNNQSIVALSQQVIERALEQKASLMWSSRGFRGPLDRGIGRNLMGFHDGISVPRTQEDLTELVWISSSGPLAGCTIAVVRKMPIDLEGFQKLSVAHQERAVGRERASGRPLSGGELMSDPDIHAKSAAGETSIDVAAHIRRAHPLPSGAKGLMLRRSYSYFDSAQDSGLIFVSFQSELRTFVATQHRMDEMDALMDYTRTTQSGTFLIGPGQQEGKKLGSFLRG